MARDGFVPELSIPVFRARPMSPQSALIRETFPVGPLQCNCTIIGDPITKKAIVVDPGGNHELILARLDALGLKVVSIIHTHAHLDHFRSEEHTSELQSHSDLHSFPTRRSSDLRR